MAHSKYRYLALLTGCLVIGAVIGLSSPCKTSTKTNTPQPIFKADHPIPLKPQLGRTFMEIQKEYGECLKTPEGKPRRNKSIWPKTLGGNTATAQTEWHCYGLEARVLWLPPEGARGPAEIIHIKDGNGNKLTPVQIKGCLIDNGDGLPWNPTVYGYQRTDGATAEITPDGLIIKSARIAEMENAQDRNAQPAIP